MKTINNYLQEKKMYFGEIVIRSPHGVKNKITVTASDHDITEDEAEMIKGLIKDKIEKFRNELYKYYLKDSKENYYRVQNVPRSYFKKLKAFHVNANVDHMEILFDTCGKLKGHWGVSFDKKRRYKGVAAYSC